MRRLGFLLLYSSVVLRAAVMTRREPELYYSLPLLAVYGLLLLAEGWLSRQKPIFKGAYLFFQAVLVVGMLLSSNAEDFFAILFVLLSLQAVLFFGRQVGFLCIAAFALAMLFPLLTAEEGPAYSLAMTVLYSGFCLLFGGYAVAMQRAEAAGQQNQRMLAELRTAHLQLQDYALQLEDLAVERERNRLARDLHDSVTQTVFSMNLTVQTARLLLNMNASRFMSQLERLEELTTMAMREIQVLVSELRPRSTSSEGLPAALRRLAGETRKLHGLQVDLEITGEQPLTETLSATLYRIAQEALTNVVKHSGSSQASLRLHLDQPGPCLEIQDRGRGFDPQAVNTERGHLGLSGMLEQARELGLELSIDSQPGRGTCIRVGGKSP